MDFWTNTTDSTWGTITINSGFGASDTVYQSSYDQLTRECHDDEPLSELDQLEKRVEAVCEKGRL